MKALKISFFLTNALVFSRTIFENFCVICVKTGSIIVDLPKNQALKCSLVTSVKAVTALVACLFFFLIRYTVLDEKLVFGTYRLRDVLWFFKIVSVMNS